MRDGWRLEILGEISEVIMGRQLSPSKKMGTRPRPYIRAANIGSWGISLDEIFEMDFTEDEEARFASRIGDTLLVEGGNEKSVGCPGLVTKNEAGLCIQNTVIRCRVKNPEVFHPEFQYQVLRYMYWRRDFAELCAGTTIMHLGQKRAELVPILLPPLPEQKRIVDLISSVDSYIEALQQQLESAKRSRNAVLHELLTAGGDDWVEHKLIEMFEIYQPQTIAKSLMSEDGEFIVFGANGPIGRYHEFNHDEPEVVVTCRGATCGTINMTPPKTWITGNAMVVSPKTSGVSKEFLYWALTAGVDIQSVISGSAQPQITREGLAPVKIKIPPLSRQIEIVDLISGFEMNISRLEESLYKTKTLRSGLLSDLLSGEHLIPSSYDKVMGAA